MIYYKIIFIDRQVNGIYISNYIKSIEYNKQLFNFMKSKADEKAKLKIATLKFFLEMF